MADLFSLQDIMGLGGYPNAPPADLGQPYGGGGGISGLLGSQRMIGLGMGLLAGNQFDRWGPAMKGYQTGAGEDLKAQAITRQAQQNAMANQLARDRMAQQESQFTRSLAASDKPKAQIQFKPGGYDEDGNQTYKAYIFQPDAQGNFTGREIPIEQAQALQQAGVPAAGAPAPPPGPETPQQFTDSPESTNVEDRRDQPYFQNPQVAAPPGTPPNVLEQLKRMGVKGPGIQPGLKSYGTHAGTIAAEAASGKMTEQQAKNSLYGSRMEMAEGQIREGDLEKVAKSYRGRALELAPEGAGQLIAGSLQSKEYNQYEAAKRAWIMGIARQESMANIKTEEFHQYDKIYFPQPYDDEKTIENKRKLRVEAINQVKSGAGPAFKAAEEAKASKAAEEAKARTTRELYPNAGGAVKPRGAAAAEPVRVSSPEEALRLPRGTPIILPDGTPGRVP